MGSGGFGPKLPSSPNCSSGAAPNKVATFFEGITITQREVEPSKQWILLMVYGQICLCWTILSELLFSVYYSFYSTSSFWTILSCTFCTTKPITTLAYRHQDIAIGGAKSPTVSAKAAVNSFPAVRTSPWRFRGRRLHRIISASCIDTIWLMIQAKLIINHEFNQRSMTPQKKT